MVNAELTGKDPEHIQPPERLDQSVAKTTELGFDMASEPLTGALLGTLAASKPGGRLLELGTGTGMATAWLLAGMSAEATLNSVDTNREVQDVAREFLGHDDRLRLALEECLRLVKRGFYVIDDVLPQPNWPEGHAAKVQPLIQRLADRHDFSVLSMAWASRIVIAAKRSTRGIDRIIRSDAG